MKNQLSHLKSLKPEIAWLGLIFLAGTVLRFYHLGHDSLWLDEAGVAYAARAGTITEMLEVVRSHVMAMPLDYLVVWLFGKISLQEAVLRIPAAIWGSLSLLLAYRFYRQFSGAAPALLGLLVLALSPLHIQYSQELRFYSSLIFFYLLSSLLLWKAIQRPSWRAWIWLTAAAITGIYFHPYVLFSFANGLVWLLLSPPKDQPARLLRIQFLTSATLCLLAFLAGYLKFSASNTFQIPLMVFEQSHIGAIASGLGWLPFSTAAPDSSTWTGWIWGVLCAVLEIGGIAVAIASGSRPPHQAAPKLDLSSPPLVCLFYSFLLQFTAVLASDVLTHYFFAPRQLLMLLPILCLFAGVGAHTGIMVLARRLEALPRHFATGRWQAIVTILAGCIILLTSLPAIALYIQDDKGNSRAISQLILEQWQPGDSILVTPAYDGFVYKYYVEYAFARPDVSERLWVVNWDDLQETGSWDGNLFLITPSTLTPTERDQLHALGLAPSFRSNPLSRYAKTLWSRKNYRP